MKFRGNALVFLSIVAWLILAGLAVADSDTCCLDDALSNLGSYCPLQGHSGCQAAQEVAHPMAICLPKHISIAFVGR